MSIYVPGAFGLLVKVGEKENSNFRKSTELFGAEKEGCSTFYFKLILWELEKQLTTQSQKRELQLNQAKGSNQTGHSSFQWLADTSSLKPTMNPAFYHLLEKKCCELIPIHAEAALKKFQALNCDEIPIHDIPWKVLEILREEKNRQAQTDGNGPEQQNVFTRLELWLGWKHKLRRSGRVAPEGDVEMGVNPSAVSEIEMDEIPPQQKVVKAPEKPSLVKFKRSRFSLKRLSSSTKYSVLSDDWSQPSPSRTQSVSSGNQQEITLEAPREDNPTIVRDRGRSQFQRFKDSFTSALGTMFLGRFGEELA